MGLMGGVGLPPVEVDDVHDGGSGSPSRDAVLRAVSLYALQGYDQASEIQQTTAESKQEWALAEGVGEELKNVGGKRSCDTARQRLLVWSIRLSPSAT